MSNHMHNKWYAVPGDNAHKGTPTNYGWQVFDETGGIILESGERELVEHIVDLHNREVRAERLSESTLERLSSQPTVAGRAS